MPSEQEIISRIRKRARPNNNVVVGIGDDAAVIDVGGEHELIACCDLVVEGVHFQSDWAEPKLIGHKALAVTLSDVAAMGGRARFAMISMAVPGGRSPELADEIFRGIFDLADHCEVTIIGGDTSASPGLLFIDTIILGQCVRGRAITRAGAKAGDTIYVTGTLGASACGLALLESGSRLESLIQNDPADFKNDLRREALLKHLAPGPRLEFGRALGEAGLATAMIDISDGLTTDLSHILEESACGAIIRAGAIPVAECAAALSAERASDPLTLALSSGEEYELLFTVHPDNRARVEQLSSSLGLAVTAIGEMVDARGLRLERDGALEPLRPSGYEHFI